jgi:hypothetical protein
VAALGLRIADDFLVPIEADHQVQSQ